MEIKAGTGGKDSSNFVFELFSYYTKYAKKNGLEVEIIHSDESEITAQIIGKNAELFFYYESGKHACCRVPPTEKRGRRQTSIVAVAVLPVMEKIDNTIDMKDVEIQTKLASIHAGGQHLQKTQSAVRAIHKPTGLTVVIQGRSQPQNKKLALTILSQKVTSLREGEAKQKRDKNRRDQLKGCSRSDKVRTYHFCNDVVTDHRTGRKTRIKEIEKGNFEEIL